MQFAIKMFFAAMLGMVVVVIVYGHYLENQNKPVLKEMREQKILNPMKQEYIEIISNLIESNERTILGLSDEFPNNLSKEDLKRQNEALRAAISSHEVRARLLTPTNARHGHDIENQ